jgi:hypothetical protein
MYRKYIPRLLHSVGQLAESINATVGPVDHEVSRIPTILTEDLQDLEHVVRCGPVLYISDLVDFP